MGEAFETLQGLMSNISVHCIPDRNTGTAQYIVHDGKVAIVVDPVLDFDLPSGQTTPSNIEKLVAYIEEHKLKVEWVFETHVHADHITGASELRARFPDLKLAIGAGVCKVQEMFKPVYNLNLKTDGSQFDKLFVDGESMQVGAMKMRCMHTPGHTADSSAYVFEGVGIFLGDTMFYPDKGTARCDFPNGSAELLKQSIDKILAFPDDTRLFICHDYPKDRDFKWETSVAQQKAENIHLQPGTDFVQMRRERDETLKVPHLIIPSVQLNLAAGVFPEPEGNGVSYIKVPLNHPGFQKKQKL